jgi:hypothetical protein
MGEGHPAKEMDWRFKSRQEKLRSRAGQSVQELRLSEVLRAMRSIFVRRHGGERKGKVSAGVESKVVAGGVTA